MRCSSRSSRSSRLARSRPSARRFTRCSGRASKSLSDMAPIFVIAVGLAIAVVTDVRTRRIPNALTASMAVAGFGIAAMGLGVTPVQAALGLVVGLAVMMPGHVIGATGAGDVKLLAAIGSLLGPSLPRPGRPLSAVAA